MLKRLLFLGIICLIGSIYYSTATTGTTIHTEICDSTSGPTLDITSPVSDSIVNTPAIPIQGTASRTSQIDIYLNGLYSSSIAVGPTGQINTTTALNRGTNTIRLDAYYSCNQTTNSSNLVVTYEPAATPSNGSSTDTNFPSEDSPTTPPRDTPEALSPNSVEPPTPEQPSGDPAHQPELEPLSTPKEGTSDKHGSASNKTSLAFLALALTAPSLLLLVLERVNSGIWLGVRQLSMVQKWLIRGSGLLLAGLLFFLLYGAALNV